MIGEIVFDTTTLTLLFGGVGMLVGEMLFERAYSRRLGPRGSTSEIVYGEVDPMRIRFARNVFGGLDVFINDEHVYGAHTVAQCIGTRNVCFGKQNEHTAKVKYDSLLGVYTLIIDGKLVTKWPISVRMTRLFSILRVIPLVSFLGGIIRIIAVS